MRDNQKTWELIGETSASIYPLAQDIMGAQFEKHFSEQRFYNPTFVASYLALKPLTAELYSKRNPYAKPEGVSKLLADTAKADYLNPGEKGGYVASEKGANAIRATHEAFYNHINELNKFPAEYLEELDTIFDKLVLACTKNDLPNGNLCLEISHNGHPKVEAGSLAKIDQHLDDLNAFRDDAHITAWEPIGVSGHVWEVFTFVWNGEANTGEKLVERLPYREYTAKDYTKTLERLEQQGWIGPGEDGYKMTDEGKKIRDDAEAQTNNNFFTPWEKLTDDEVKNLGELLANLKETNLKIIEENKAE